VPELPEVETVVRDLRPMLVGRRIVRVWTSRRRLRNGVAPGPPLVQRTIADIGRRGKWIMIHLDRGCALVHLGMTGQLTVGPADRPRDKHVHLVVDLDDGRQLHFRDIRRFGSVRCFADREQLEQFLSARLGPEPFTADRARFRLCLARTRRTLKAALLDQHLLAGVGNIYADESLFTARLAPTRRGCDLTTAEADRLLRAVARVLRLAVDRRGSSIRNYIGGSGLEGSYQREFRVYGRAGQPCVRCRSPIAAIRLAGRSTHFCPKCQGNGGPRHLTMPTESGAKHRVPVK
jgi:formamidopyrimidine-DNA glycosylase